MASAALRTWLASARCLRCSRVVAKRAHLFAFATPEGAVKFCSTPIFKKDAAVPKESAHSIGGPQYFKSLYYSSHETTEHQTESLVAPASEGNSEAAVFQLPNIAGLESDDLSTLQNELACEVKLDALSEDVDAEFLDGMGPALPKAFNLAAYANKSITVQRFVQLGVDLSVLEKKGLGQEIITLDFKKEVEPVIRFLTSQGVPAERLGWWFTKNPHLFREPLENLQVRVDYLLSKRFSPEAVTRILSNAPLFLAYRVNSMDYRLGFLQRVLSLSGAECNAFSIKEEMGFSVDEMKQLIMVCPKLLISSRDNIVKAFTYLHKEAGLSHAQLMQFPAILRTRECIYKPRHQFLVKLGRAQYDPKEPNYVSPKALVTGVDAVFCENVAKTSVDKYNEFLRTL
ncbi:hypothetical protein MRX96_054306 [Rhipicephalus microplus]